MSSPTKHYEMSPRPPPDTDAQTTGIPMSEVPVPLSVVPPTTTHHIQQHAAPPADALNEDDVIIRIASKARRKRPWHYGLCHCCTDCDPCMEAWFCFPCQISRQCNLFMNNRATIHWPFCLFVFVSDCCIGFACVSCMFVCQTRAMARDRYGISGGACGDCCASFLCQPCTLQQILMEMTVMNDFPGATCYQPFVQPARVEMQ